VPGGHSLFSIPHLAPPRRHTLNVALLACACVALGVAAWDLAAGGFYVRLFGIRVSSWEANKPFRIAMIAIVAALWLHDRDVEADRASWHQLPRAAPWVAGVAALASAAVAIHFGIFAAGGADAYGYVSQAHLWASGRLMVPDRLAPLTPALGRAVAPLGYLLGRDPGWLVPVYAPGLPMMMALAMKAAGPAGVYFVVPLLAAATVWSTYLLARRTADGRVALMAAALLAFSPIFLFQSLEPMSDVPVTAWWIGAWVLAASPGAWAPLGAGLAVSAAVLTRPNLVPLAIVLAVAIGLRGGAARVRRVALFAVGVVPGCLVVAWVNNHWYGSPLRSGYGALETLYAWDRFGPNLRHYTKWLVDLHTPAILLALAAPLLRRTTLAIPMLAFAVALLCAYLFYFVYDSWPFTRFLLPAIPLLFILGSSVVLWLVARVPLAFRGAIVLLICTLLPCWYVLKARSLNVFAIQRAEHRYVAVGRAVGDSLPPQAVVFTVIQSGSVRWYGDRATLRWDVIEPAAFGRIVETLRAHGCVPYVLLEEWEEAPFREQFAGASEFGRLDWPPTMEYDGISKTRIYALADRARYLAGARITTRTISDVPPGE
jgi:hypothetical protein